MWGRGEEETLPKMLNSKPCKIQKKRKRMDGIHTKGSEKKKSHRTLKSSQETEPGNKCTLVRRTQFLTFSSSSEHVPQFSRYAY